MALLCFSSFTLTPLHSPLPSSSSSSSSSSPSSILAVATTAVSGVQLSLPPKCLSGVRISTPFAVSKRRAGAAVVVRADAADGATPAEEGGSPPPEAVPVNELPLESKLKERQEQRLRMKLAKKIRLRRKRLVRKRRLRKKGRWPPSKMKKLKNV